MKSQIIVTSIVLLLIILATFPCACYSLGSSVTSNNNSIIVIGDSGLSFSDNNFTSNEVTSRPSWAPSGSDVIEISNKNSGDDETFNPPGGGKTDVVVTVDPGHKFAIFIQVANNTSPKFTLSCSGTEYKYTLNGSSETGKQGYLTSNKTNGNSYLVASTVTSTGVLTFTSGEAGLTLTMESNVNSGCKFYVYFVLLDGVTT